ncbi:MAG: hypothetical protein M9894_37860 [Planctomycetes bacterium]|nr:hypothetical protein [Planctomycetota bacterium]
MKARRGRHGGGGRGRGPAPRRDDEREWQDLERFVALAVEADALEGFGLDPDEAAGLLLAAPAGDPVDALAPQVASLERARAAHDLLRALLRVSPGDAGLDRHAVAAATRLASDCVRDGALPDHPFWEVYLAASLQRALTTGALLDRLLLPELDPDWVAGAVDRALARDDVRAALAAAGASAPADARAAADLVAGLAAEDDPALPPLGTDAVLHLLRLRHALLSGEAGALLSEGLGDQRRAALAARVEEAARADLTPALRDEARDAVRRLLEAAAPPDRPALGALWLTLAAPDPPHEHQLLRGLLGRALVEPLLPEDEEPLAVAVWADPGDRAALEAYERHLRAAGAEARAERVRRYAGGA